MRMNIRPASRILLSGRNTRLLIPSQHLTKSTLSLTQITARTSTVSCSKLNIPQKCLYSTSEQPSVIHCQTDKMFSLDYEGHETAYLKYRFLDLDQTRVDMFTTQVPPSLGGRGVAKILAEAAFTWALENKIKMRLSCWYLSGYLKRHPREDVQNLVI